MQGGQIVTPPPVTTIETGGNRLVLFTHERPVQRKPVKKPARKPAQLEYVAVRPARLAARAVSRTEVSATVNRDRALTAQITAGAKVAVDVAVWRLQTKPEPAAINVVATTQVAAAVGRERSLVADLLAATSVTAELNLTPPTVRDLDAEFADLLRETLILCEA